jgi:signal transduction histidine kinase
MTHSDPRTEWLNTVAHDLKTPINAVRGCIELVQQLGPLNERQQHFAWRALAGLQRMEYLVAKLLDISWIDADVPLELAACNPRTVIHDAVDMLKDVAEKREVSIQVAVDEGLDSITADALRLTQVVDNLVSNAIKYNHKGGAVRIQAARNGDAVLFSVQDTGIGISAEDQARVFERFFRARQSVAMKVEGTGLGLAITRAIVQKHGGRIWLESEPGEGTTFYFTLPLNRIEGDGDHEADESSQNLGEGVDSRDSRRMALASEERDVVDDDIQETREYTQMDSTGDEL